MRNLLNTQAFYIRYNYYVTSSQSVQLNEFKHLCDGLDIHMHISLLEFNSLAPSAIVFVLGIKERLFDGLFLLISVYLKSTP